MTHPARAKTLPIRLSNTFQRFTMLSAGQGLSNNQSAATSLIFGHHQCRRVVGQ